MIKAKALIGRPIVAMDTGKKIDQVHDLVFDHQAGRLMALLVDEAGWFRAARVIPFEQVRSIGEDAIMVESESVVVAAKGDNRIAELLEGKVNLMGLAVLTVSGEKLGRITDLLLDERSGAVQGYEASGGMFADLASGRSVIPTTDALQIGENSVIVPDAVAVAMRENPGGIVGAIQGTGRNISESVQQTTDNVRQGVDQTTQNVRQGFQETAQNVRESLDHTAQNVRQSYTETAQNVRQSVESTSRNLQQEVQDASQQLRSGLENVSESASQRQRDLLIGKVAGADLLAPDGAVIVRQGDHISQSQASEADRLGKLAELTALATGGTVAATATGIFNQVRSKVQEGLEDLREATFDKQREFLIGKTAGRDVLTASGEVIVHQGSVISAFTVERAQATGNMLELLGAVSVDGPETGMAARTFYAAPTVQDVVGQRVTRDVSGVGGSLIAAQGQVITAQMAERAQQEGVVQALIDAAEQPASGAPEFRQQAAQLTGELGGRVQEGVSVVSREAGELLGRAKSWLGDKRQELEHTMTQQELAAQQQRIAQILGRPVNRVVLAPDDSVILNMGDIVTNQAVQAARERGVLDLLLDSVSL